ncbi:hypothetical protein L3X38_036587 [Prunus dulcis]|uniref:Uncharacterized protein n=1 Tax=Prunus dulcis TaxID=3755 RepID=A0AAD4V1Q6_PRUDU|nr:hypothetical protein L3X38_036587 [Prunus dulcis]
MIDSGPSMAPYPTLAGLVLQSVGAPGTNFRLFTDRPTTGRCARPPIRYIDELFEGQAPSCYCASKEEHVRNGGGHGEGEVSKTLYQRKNAFRIMGFLGFIKKIREIAGVGAVVNRWSDCGCDSCLSWMNDCDQKLHFVVREPSQG